MEESIEVVPSADNGNVPAEAPSVPTEKPEVPTEVKEEPVTPTEPTPAEAELFELPDGRKVDAATLAVEFKENFLPEFTRKSQKLAELEKGNLPEAPKSKFADPEYVPQSYEEIVQAAKEAALNELSQREQERIRQAQEIENAVASQLEAVKKIDPTVNENQLFLHANKYGFRDLTVAHQNMKDMADLAKKVQTTTAQNIQKRNDPVSISPGANGTVTDPSAFSNAREFLRSLNS